MAENQIEPIKESHMIPLPKARISSLARKSEDFMDFWNAIYNAVIPNWENIKKLIKYPTVSKTTLDYIDNKVIEIGDKTNKRSSSILGWMNKGFDRDDTMADWVVDISTCQIIYKKAEETKQAGSI